MEKLKKIIFNVVFYITIVAIIAALLFIMIIIVMKLNVHAMTNGKPESVCVLIDPGHGAEDGGAVSDDGLVEKDINLNVSQCLRDYLVLSGYEVRMTRDSDSLLGSGDTLKERLHDDFAKRLEMYNDDDVDIVVSVHQNKFTESKYSGAQVFYSPNEPKSETLAVCLRRAIRGFLQPDNEREITKAGSNIYLLNNCNNPCVLVECGFLSNPEEAKKLSDESYQRELAFTIYCGILEYACGAM